jgi:hypothetical protein
MGVPETGAAARITNASVFHTPVLRATLPEKSAVS